MTYRQRSEHEIKNKLQQKGYSYSLIEQVLDYLKDYRLIDDHEFATQFVYNKVMGPKPIGPNRMKYELIQLGIDRTIIAEALNKIDHQTEIDLAHKLVEKTINKNIENLKLNKLLGLLQRRGFSYDVIRKVLTDFDLDVT